MNKITSTCFILLTIALMAGCESAQIAFPAGSDTNDFDKKEIKGRGVFSPGSGSFSIGGEKVEWTRSALSSSNKRKNKSLFADEDKSTTNIRKQEMSIKISGSDISTLSGTFNAEAEVEEEVKRKSKRSMTTSSAVMKHVLKGRIEGDNSVYELLINLAEEGKRGTLQGKNINFEIEPSNSVKGSSFGFVGMRTGFYVYDKEILIAVVDVLNNGAVYMSKTLSGEKKSVVYALTAALLQYNDIEGIR